MKIGKLCLVALFIVAVILPSAAQDRQYDVKLTVYQKEDVQAQKQEKQKKEKPAKELKQKAPKAEKTVAAEPAKTENAREVQLGVSPTSGAIAKVTYVEEGVDKAHPKGVELRGDPTKIETQTACDKPCEVADKTCPDKSKACCGEKKCDKCAAGKPCEKGKACCGEKKCDKCAAGESCEKGKPTCKMPKMAPCAAAPVFYNSAQYRDYKRMLVTKAVNKIEGSRYYIGTNALADLVLAPNVQAEWRKDEKLGVRLTVGGFYNPCLNGENGAGGWWITPEVRWYLGAKKAWYAGAMMQVYQACNTPGKDEVIVNANDGSTTTIPAVKDKTTAISMGGTFGYMQRIKPNFGIDYNVGVGVSAIGHPKAGNPTINKTSWRAAFSFTQVGVSLVWGVGCKKSCCK
jgi:hypothetical protein